ncbi:transporter substrate-binding domain-containing protein [Lacticaseibacillus absianus]|uniref:transporter substrate-binding domain-containing protein n=1 Tax=Lacticaseibacillus absianus TaxID=2729623 RepID=UPI0015C97E88|nr:transporter substrate-binding domain-containing protein [Lacticaseibacillus absianus]
MKKMTRLLSTLAVTATALLALAGCGQNQSSNADTVAQIKKAGEIKIAVFGDLQPYGWIDQSGKRVGYDLTLARKLAKDLGVKAKFVQVNADGRVDALKAGKVDLVLANFTVTPDRKEVVDFAKPYMQVSVGVVSKKTAPVTKVSQLAGKDVIVTKGTTAEQYFTEKQKAVTLQKYDSKTQQFNALKNDRAAALADDNSYLYAWVKNNPTYTVGIKTLGPSSYIAPAVKKGNKALLKWVNQEITKLNGNGFFKTDYEQTLAPYFGRDIQPEDIIITK